METKITPLADAKTINDFKPYVRSAAWSVYDTGHDGENGNRYVVSFIDDSSVASIKETGITQIIAPGIVAECFISAGLDLLDVPEIEEVYGLQWSDVSHGIMLDAAVEKAKEYGDGWRLPTADEMVEASMADIIYLTPHLSEFRWTPHGLENMEIGRFHFADRDMHNQENQALNARFVKEIDYVERRALTLSVSQSGDIGASYAHSRENFFGSFGKDSKASNSYSPQNFKR